MTTTLQAPTVTVREVARALGAVPLPGDLQALADALNVPLTLVTDWQGRPALTTDQAAALVAASRERDAERVAAKAAAQVTEAAERADEDAEIQAAGTRAADVAYLRALLLNMRDPHLLAAEAAAVIYTTRDVSKAPTVEEGAKARQRLIDGGILPAPKRRTWW